MSTAVMEVTAVLSKEADGDDLPRIELQENNWPVLLLQTINTYRVDGKVPCSFVHLLRVRIAHLIHSVFCCFQC